MVAERNNLIEENHSLSFLSPPKGMTSTHNAPPHHNHKEIFKEPHSTSSGAPRAGIVQEVLETGDKTWTPDSP